MLGWPERIHQRESTPAEGNTDECERTPDDFTTGDRRAIRRSRRATRAPVVLHGGLPDPRFRTQPGGMTFSVPDGGGWLYDYLPG